MENLDFQAYLERCEEQILPRVLLTWGLVTAESIRDAYQELQRLPAGERCKLGQMLIRKRIIQIADYSKAMVVVRQQAQILYQQRQKTTQVKNAPANPSTRTYTKSPVRDDTTRTYDARQVRDNATQNYEARQVREYAQENQSKATTRTATRSTKAKLNPKHKERATAKRKRNGSRQGKIRAPRKKDAHREKTHETDNVPSTQHLPAHNVEDAQTTNSDINSRFGSYEIICEIARGGMGIVYKARQLPLNRIVALKVLLSGGAASETEIQRFRREAEAAGALQHPNIVSIYEIGEQDGYHYFTMDFIEGPTLQALLKKRTRTKKLLQILEKVAKSLDHAHKRGVVHRDIKPSNILVSSEGEPKLTDFGLAKKLDANTMLTESGAALGTPFYMAPEQTLGSKNVDGRADIYAMGVILYEILTHRLPFSAGTLVDLYHKIVEEDPIPPTKVSRKVDKELEIICLKAMEKSCERRYQTPLEFADDLKRYLSGEAITAKRASFVYRIIRKMKRRGQKMIIVGATGILLISVALFVYWKFTETSDYDRRKAKAKILVEEGKAAIRNSKFIEGMNKWEKAIQLCPQLKAPYFARGNAYQKRLEYLSAITEFKRILQIDPRDPVVYYRIGESYSELKEWDKAIQNFTPAIQYNPKYIEAYTKRAYAYQNRGAKGDWQLAIKDFEKAAAISKTQNKKD